MQLVKTDIVKSINVELIPVSSATALTWTFPDIPFLRGKQVLGISLSVSAVGVTSGRTNIGTLMALGTGAYSCFITLVDDKSNNFIQQMPVVELSNTALIGLAGNNFVSCNTNGILLIKPRVVVWNKCFVYFPTATGLASHCLMFNIIYK